MGPAFIAAIGYIDPVTSPPTFRPAPALATSRWGVVWANLMAMLIQVMSAKLGIATGKKSGGANSRPLPASCGVVLLGAGEIIAMATDLAESLLARLSDLLVLGVSLLQGAVLTGIATFLILMLQRRGQKPLEK